MDAETIRGYCLSKPGTTEGFPFDETTLVFKVANKMYALIDLELGQTINLKCDPEIALELREIHAEILPGYHMNKKHWNTVRFTGSLSETLVQQLIDTSYELVVASLPVKIRKELPDARNKNPK